MNTRLKYKVYIRAIIIGFFVFSIQSLTAQSKNDSLETNKATTQEELKEKKNETKPTDTNNSLWDEIYYGLLGFAGGVGFILSLFGIMNARWHWKMKEENRKKGIIKVHKTLGEISHEFKNMNLKNVDTIYQTRIESLPLTPSLDILNNERYSEIKFKRIFTLSHPIDLNFAIHSFQKEEPNSDKLNNYIFSSLGSFQNFRAYPNITVWKGKATQITFPFSDSELKQEDPLLYPLAQNPKSSDSVGITIYDTSFSELMINYLEKFVEQEDNNGHAIISDAQSLFWTSDKKLDYLLAVSDSIFKEILNDKILSRHVVCLGVVGSVAKYSRGIIKDYPDDLDIVIIYDKINDKKFLERTKFHVSAVLRRLSFGEVQFQEVYQAGPLEPKTDERYFPVHVLIDDTETSSNWAKLIAYDWPNHILTRYGKIPKNACLNKLTKEEILNSRFGIEYCLNILKEGKPITFYEWSINKSDKPFYTQKEKSDFNMEQFLSYCIKWGSINYSRFQSIEGLKVETTLKSTLDEIKFQKKFKDYNRILNRNHNDENKSKELVIEFLEEIKSKIK